MSALRLIQSRCSLSLTRFFFFSNTLWAHTVKFTTHLLYHAWYTNPQSNATMYLCGFAAKKLVESICTLLDFVMQYRIHSCVVSPLFLKINYVFESFLPEMSATTDTQAFWTSSSPPPTELLAVPDSLKFQTAVLQIWLDSQSKQISNCFVRKSWKSIDETYVV